VSPSQEYPWDAGPVETRPRAAAALVFDDEAPPARALMQHRAQSAVVEAPLPRPKAVTAAVFTDVLSRTLTVRQAEPASGYERSLWIKGWQALRQASAAGWPPGAAPWIFADAPKSHRVIHGVPVEGGALSFTWPVGSPGFAELVGRPGLYAVVTLDISTHYFSTVKFLHRLA
jgi:hypothetical protein